MSADETMGRREVQPAALPFIPIHLWDAAKTPPDPGRYTERDQPSPPPPSPTAPTGRPDTSDHQFRTTRSAHETGMAFDVAWHVDAHERHWSSWMWRLVRGIATGMAIALSTDMSLGRLAIVSAFVGVALLAHDEVSA